MSRIINEIGNTYGDAVVIGQSPPDASRKARWTCRCKICSSEFTVLGQRLRNGKTTSCPRCSRVKNMRNKTYNRLTVLDLNHVSDVGDAYWECLCICGERIVVRGDSLRSGKTTSCSCRQKEIVTSQCGENSPSWNSNLTDDERELNRNTVENRNWIQTVFERDNHTCQCCGERGSRLVAHHLFAWNTYTGLRYVVCNGITWCETCHTNFHKQFGYGDNTPFQTYLFLNNMEAQ